MVRLNKKELHNMDVGQLVDSLAGLRAEYENELLDHSMRCPGMLVQYGGLFAYNKK